MESDKTMLWSLMGVMSLQSNTIPTYIHQLYKLWKSYRANLGAYSHIDVPQYEESSMGNQSNEIYCSVKAYLSNLDATARTPSAAISRSRRTAKLFFTLPSHHTIKDDFQGATIWWTHEVISEDKSSGAARDRGRTERKYILKFLNKERAKVLPAYIDHISDFAEQMKRRSQERKLYSNITNMHSHSPWSSVPFKHPSTFKTVALDPVLKEKVIKDLDCFQQSREFYHRIGRAWKRGYLLYGPPGTGKSSLIAAIANHMEYDVYDLELTKVLDNASLRELLLATANKSVIVIEDIDCAANLPDKAVSRPSKPNERSGDSPKPLRQTITLSGLLNFADGLWSNCGEERILIFTTNHKDRLDPALLRCGRMDMHILLTYCEFPAFKLLVFNYLEIMDHELFPAVEEKMQCGGRLTPAEICEILIQNVSDHDSAIAAVIAALEYSIANAATAHLNRQSSTDINKETSEENSSSSSSPEEE